jgi:predicted HTH transcriptional regulator
MGTGISRITNAMQSVGLPLPNFELEGFFMVTLMRDSYFKRKNGGQLSITDTDDTDNDTDTDTDDTDNDTDKKETSLKRIEERVINLIEVNKNISINEIVEKTNKSRSTIQRTINKLKNSEKLMRVGNTKTGHWVIIKNIGENGHE